MLRHDWIMVSVAVTEATTHLGHMCARCGIVRRTTFAGGAWVATHYVLFGERLTKVRPDCLAPDPGAGVSSDRPHEEGTMARAAVRAKATKEKANYRDGTPTRRCGLCTMYRPPGSCTAVQGAISRSKLCDYFERRR